MREYKDCYIAFIDVLGFKDLVDTEKCETIYRVFKEIHMNSTSNLIFNGVEISAFEEIQHRILSDSIILFIDATIKDGFAALIDVCQKLQRALANRVEPILLRGGIVKGLLYCEENIIYGKGLTNAYLLENKLAKYPRIIFTGDTLKEGKKNTYYLFPFLECMSSSFTVDDDDLFFVNYLPTLRGNLEETKNYSDRLYCLCDKMLTQAIDSNLRDKYLWLKKKVDEAIEHMPDIKELYKKEDETRQALEFECYNKRFEIYNKGKKNE